MNDQIPNEGNEGRKSSEGDPWYAPLDPAKRERSFRIWEQVKDMYFGRDFPEAYNSPTGEET
ncbi:hypothetical protein [Microbacterium sp. NPDC055599]